MSQDDYIFKLPFAPCTVNSAKAEDSKGSIAGDDRKHSGDADDFNKPTRP